MGLEEKVLKLNAQTPLLALRIAGVASVMGPLTRPYM